MMAPKQKTALLQYFSVIVKDKNGEYLFSKEIKNTIQNTDQHSNFTKKKQ
jgi:hypothetical protein